MDLAGAKSVEQPEEDMLTPTNLLRLSLLAALLSATAEVAVAAPSCGTGPVVLNS